ncbi:hypothetical protein AB0M28_10550 [Streptomyces sp. NPDC051940]|uniref:hypothetical protein n=1 Tax=Streptomyces sp. NPDC051940 TaxID=3155675 RepID=UPI003444A19F
MPAVPVPFPDLPPADVATRIALVDRALTLPFPDGDDHQGVRWSGPGHHLLTLHRTRDFWEPDGPDDRELAEEEIEEVRAAVTAAVTDRWGLPVDVDLFPYLGCDWDLQPPEHVPEPVAQLCNQAGSMRLWQPPGTDRWLGLAVGQADTEFPLELLAAIGGPDSLPQRRTAKDWPPREW